MTDLAFLRSNPALVFEGAKSKGITIPIDRILSLDQKIRSTQSEVEKLRHERSQKNEQIAKKNPKEKKLLIEEMRKVSDRISNLEHHLNPEKIELESLLELIPNLPHPSVIKGKDESENIVHSVVGKIPDFSFLPKDYLTLGKTLGLIDTTHVRKASGTRFGALTKEAALLEIAIIRWVFETCVGHRFIPIIPPAMITTDSMNAMGYIQQGGEREVYMIPEDRMCFVGTSEQSLGPMHRDEVFQSEELPVRYAAFSSCFRREAGSYGKDTRGILRVHQFDKIEMFSFCLPSQSEDEHRLFLSIEESLVRALKLPYRVIDICSSELGFPAAKKWDIETWIPSERQYRETHSTSNCTDFQSRRLNIRFKDPKINQKGYVHTVNGTGFAIGRLLIAIFENFQTEHGTIQIPAVLHPYCGFTTIPKK